MEPDLDPARSKRADDRQLSHGARIVLDRFEQLAGGEQLRVYETLREYLSRGFASETAGEEQLSRRRDALTAMRTASGHLGLAAGQAPTAAAFERACRELGLGWNRQHVIRAFGRFRFAQEVFIGGQPRTAAATQAVMRAASGRRLTHEGSLEALRRWLESAPASRTTEAYDAWARGMNASNGATLPLPLNGAIRKALRLVWKDALRVAAGDVELEALTKRSPTVRIDDCGGPFSFVTLRGVADELGCSYPQAVRSTAEPSFPLAVAVIGRCRLWLREDIGAFRAGRPWPVRPDNALQDQIVTTAELAKRLGISRFCNVRPEKDRRVPPTGGRVGGVRYWLRDDVESWFAEGRGKRRPRSSSSERMT